MSRKRPARVAFCAADHHPVSAFAAAKARSNIRRHDHEAADNDSNLNDGDKDVNDEQNLNIDSPGPVSLFDGVIDYTSDNQDILSASEDAHPDQSHASDDQIQQPYRHFSTVSPEAVSVLDHATQLTLQKHERVVAVGQYDLEVIQGAITVAGALLRSSPTRHRVWAPSTHALPCIVAKTDAAVIILRHVTSNPLSRLADLSPLWTRLWDASTDDSTFSLLRASIDDPLSRLLDPHEIDAETQSTIASISSTGDTPHVLITGPKGCGKSTTCRTLLNTFLTAPPPHNRSTCFWLDIDPGQPEFAPPGHISLVQIRSPLLGPAYTHPLPHPALPIRTIRGHALATLSPKEDVDHFLACVCDLMNHYRRLRADFPFGPLIINCSGWVTGSGLDILLEIIRQHALTDIILAGPMDPTATGSIENASKRVWKLPARERLPTSRTAAELRQIQTMSYFHTLAPVNGSPTWSASSLTTCNPWTVSYSGPDQRVTAILSYHETIAPDMLWTVLDGMVVAIVAVNASTARDLLFEKRDTTPESESDHKTPRARTSLLHRTPEDLPLLQRGLHTVTQPLDPTNSHCIGYGLVRAIDTRTRELQLTTPIPAAQLRSFGPLSFVDQHDDRDDMHDDQRVLFLVRGRFDSPDWAFLEDVYRASAADEPVPNTPYVAIKRPDAGFGNSVWRVRHLPRKNV